MPHNPCILLLVPWGDAGAGITVRNASGMCTRQRKLRRWWLELQQNQKWVRGCRVCTGY
ncbi:UNVERIFIED_CONTAM: hypothetical protein Sradi_0366500 [Sesamum radiatum]|uniref:Uncharacterized protein n=1 Tax=Sesamum radiatum TaxID=300843 RepID=A0AAW2W8X7_SESRA